MEKCGLLISKFMIKYPFFKRFSQDILLRFLGLGKVEYFNKDDIIFLKGRIGVITYGSVRVMSHQSNIMKPTTIGRYKKGRILGHGESDNGITLNPQTWFITFDEQTEIMFFDHKTFSKLWSLQGM